MTGITTDPKDPDLGRGADTTPVPQNKKYLVLSPEELAKGFQRPLRDSYVHVGDRPDYPLRDLSTEESERYGHYGYVKYEEYPRPNPDGSSVVGRFWTQEQLDAKSCGAVTTMGYELAATYAREPKFYGSTYCCTCRMHRPVAEFVWDGTDERVGS
jgi:hypothetical protein